MFLFWQQHCLHNLAYNIHFNFGQNGLNIKKKFITELENIEDAELNKCLSKFYVLARKSDGSYYKKLSLFSIQAALDRNHIHHCMLLYPSTLYNKWTFNYLPWVLDLNAYFPFSVALLIALQYFSTSVLVTGEKLFLSRHLSLLHYSVYFKVVFVI